MSVAEFPSAVPSQFERTPPQDIAAEQCVLGGMMLSKDAIADVVETLRSADFYKPAHQLVYDAVTDLYGRGEPADAVTVAAELTKRGEIGRAGGAPYLHTLISSVPTAANAGYYARIVRERATLRRLVEAGTRITQMGYAGDGEVDDIVDAAQAEVYAVTDKRTSEDYLPLSEIMEGALDEIEAIGSRGGALVGVPTGFSDLDQLTNGFHPGQMIIVAARPAIGKALALDTPLPTPTGWTTMGQVQVGDQLLGADGKPTRVVAATEPMQGRPSYRVEFSDGSAIVADADHQWLTRLRVSPGPARAVLDRAVLDRAGPDRGARAGHERAVPAVWSTEEIAATLRSPATERRISHSVVNAEPLELSEQEVPLPPYALGVWLACGEPTAARFTAADPQIVMYVEAEGLHVLPRGNGVYAMRLPGVAQAGLPALGVLGRKHIPATYLRGSGRQRRALLAGVLDAAGVVTAAGSLQVTTTNRQLAENLSELVVSLGYHCAIRRRIEGPATSFTVVFAPHDDVFRLPSKRLAHKERMALRPRCERARVITAVHRVHSVPVRCVEVDNDSHLYLAGRAMVPTHNSTLGLDFARSAAIRHNLASVIFSLEMGRNEITMRLLSAEARVALHTMRSGTMTDDDWTRLARRMGEVSSAPLFIDDSPNMTMMEIRAKCRRLKQRHDLRLVVVDYLQLMQSGKRVESRQQEVSEFSRSMKLLAKELDVPVVAISQLNRGPEQRTDKRPLLSDLRESGCMPASTRLLRADNGQEVTLGQLVRSQEQPEVVSLDPHLRLVSSRLLRAFPSGIKPVFRLRLASGREVDATGNHKFLTVGGWTPLDELGPGSFIAVPRLLHAPTRCSEWPDDHLVLLAHLLGGGSIGPSGVRYATADPANRDAVEVAAGRAFGITVTGPMTRRTWQLWLPSPYRPTDERHHPIRNWLEPHGLWGSRSETKFIPEPVFGLPDDRLALFLRHLWATGGSITFGRNGQGQILRIYFATTSRRLAENVQRALLRFEVRSRIFATRKRGYGTCWGVALSGAENQARFLERIGCHGLRGEVIPRALEILSGLEPNPNIDLIPWPIGDGVANAMVGAGITHRHLAARLGEEDSGSYMLGRPGAPRRFSPPRLEGIAEIVGAQDHMDVATSHIHWDEVTEIVPVGSMPTFDATVEGTHNFVANGVIAHNSLEQDSDMVILLHREDAYERESPRAGEADLIVAKHRNGPTATVTVAFQGHYSRFVDMAHG